MKTSISFLLLWSILLGANAQTYTTWTQSSIVKYPLNGVGQPTGIGRVTHFAFHPTDPATLWATSASGGLWKTTTEGKYWYNLNTDFFPYTTKMSCIVVDYSNPNILYIGTGDTDYQAWWGGSRGVWKSTNGGATWSALSNSISTNIINRMIMSPFSTSTLLAAVDNGVWKSTDAGATWTRTLNAPTMRDVVMKPTAGGSNTVYACSDTRFWVSTDFGNTWTEKAAAQGLAPIDAGNFGSLRIGVSKANDNYVYVLAHQNNTRTFAGLFQSTNSGNNFTRRSNASDPPTAAQPNILSYNSSDGAESGSQGGYNLCITVHPNDANVVYIGSHNIWKSTNGGSSWTIRSCWGCGSSDGLHTDIHSLQFSPHYTSPYKLYVANDGGMARTKDNNDNVWESCSDGLAATEFGSFGQNHLYKELYLGGTQDNGLHFYWNKDVTTIGGGDYYEDFQSDEFDQTHMYGDKHNDKYNFNMSGGQNRTGNWATLDNFGNSIGSDVSYISNTANTNLMFAYNTKVWISQNIRAGSPFWTEMPLTNASAATYKHGSASPLNTNLLFVVRNDNTWYRSTNAAGGSPTFTTLGFPGGASSWNDAYIETHRTNQNIVWVSFGSKIYKSTNQGTSLTDITGSIPNQGIKKIIHDKFSANDGVYAAVASGVYYRDNTMADWILFSRGMPTLMDITDMDIFNDGTASSVLRVATYGRGIWQAELYKSSVTPPTADFVIYSTQQTIGGNQSPTNPCNTYFMLSDRSTGQPTSWSWSITPNTGVSFVNETSSSSRNPVITVSLPGEYTVTQTVTNAQGSTNFVSTIKYFKLTTPTACTPLVTDTYGGPYGLGISGVNFVDISNYTSLTSSYIDYTCTKSTILTVGSTYPLTVDGGDYNGGDNVVVWIDYNNDGDFLDAGERIYNDPVAAFTHTTNITVPVTGVVLNTPLRMRVAGYDNWKAKTTNLCIDNVYNEIEDYAVMIKSSPLPVELISFQATLESPAVRLDWKTASEKDLSHFMVEKTTTTDSTWVRVDQLKAKGGSTGNSYLAYDPNPSKGINYYRLKSIDKDGTVYLSNTLEVDLTNDADFSLWPVPAHNQLNVSLNTGIQIHRDQLLTILDINGKPILKSTFSGNTQTVDISTLPAGTYLAEINAAGKINTKKFVKQ